MQMNENANKPAKKTRGDILHERRVLLGEVETYEFDKKKFFLKALIALFVMAALLVFVNARLDKIYYYDDVAAASVQETVTDASLEATPEEATAEEAAQAEATVSEETAGEATASEAAGAAASDGKPKDYSFSSAYLVARYALIIVISGFRSTLSFA